ncbi:hypothetical protein Slin15195_G024590 [Septoria linicola]|uniref:Rhodopsin domain-containing protein n=1 Tax=Septoria linicola TaxID=215465 RepID=A0A9Q9EFN3_9PEZI|nr:hypothetical protein Slin14017_G023680 [Septoria linicola]USW49140.1 hypothetical protein Slin15195_G024590 [Septoria linicola]
MATSEDLSDWQSRITSRLIIKPIPAVQHPESFTPARAGLVATGVIFTLLGAFAIVCRVLTIIQRRRKIGYDDHAMFVAYGCSLAFTIAVFVSVRWGVGLELRNVPINWGVRAVQAIYTSEIFYYVTIFCIKLSLMLLYLRLAAELRGWFYYASVILLVILVLHFMTTMTVVATQCIPIEKYWYPSTAGSCIDITSFFYSTSIFTVITDVIMIALPIPIIWKIPRERKQKMAIMAAFLIAGGGTLASCIRLYSIKIFTQSPQPMRDAAPISTWSFIEINLGILCASSAVIKPIFSKTRAPSLEKEGARRLRSAAGPRGTIGTPHSKVRTTISRDLKDFGRWSHSEASTAVTSPNTLCFKSSERDLEFGTKACDGSSDRYSSRLPEPPSIYQKTPRGRQSQLISALPQRPDQPTLHAMGSHEPSNDPRLLNISHHQAKLSQAFPQYFSSSSTKGGGRNGGQPIAGW